LKEQFSIQKNKLFLTGLPYFVRQLNEMVFNTDEWDVIQLDLEKTRTRTGRFIKIVKTLLNSDIWYQIGGHIGKGTIYKCAQVFKVPVVIHWVGTDVLKVIEYFKNTKRLPYTGNLIHWAGAPWLVEELKTVGIHSKFVPLPLKLLNTASEIGLSLPQNFTIMSYIPDTRPDFYGVEHIIHLAKDFPEIQFLIVGGKGSYIKDKPSNVRFLGWVNNIKEIFLKATVVIRLTKHDGYGGTIQEALSLGRHAIWSYPFPGVFQASDYFALKDHIKHLLELHYKGQLKLNIQGQEYVRQHMNPKLLAEEIRKNLINVLDK